MYSKYLKKKFMSLIITNVLYMVLANPKRLTLEKMFILRVRLSQVVLKIGNAFDELFYTTLRFRIVGGGLNKRGGPKFLQNKINEGGGNWEIHI